MAGTETTSGSQGMASYSRGGTHRGLQAIPVELLVEVMKHLSDMAALSRLFTACPRTFIPFRDKIATDIFASILNNMSPELRESALDVLTVRSRPPIRPSRITHFIKRHLDAKVCYTPSRLREHSLAALLDLITVSESIESLSESFARDRVLGPCMQLRMPLSPVELHRIRRSFWRFQLCYDMCHPEGVDPPGDSDNVRSTWRKRHVQHQTSQLISPSVPGWVQCRGEAYRPEALSRFLPNLSHWEHEELEAIRFHLVHEVNTLQYHRSLEPAYSLHSRPVLLQRLIRDVDGWDPRSAKDHVLLAPFRTSLCAKHYPVVWDRVRHLYAASTPNTTRRFAIRVLQDGQPQWGWCLWDEQRLVERGLLDAEYASWLRDWKIGDEGLTARIRERAALVGRVHGECNDAQYTTLDRCLAAQYHLDAKLGRERPRGLKTWGWEPEDLEWMPTDMDRVFGC